MLRWKLIVALVLAYLPLLVLSLYIPNSAVTPALSVVLLVITLLPLLALILVQDDGREVAERRRNEQ